MIIGAMVTPNKYSRFWLWLLPLLSVASRDAAAEAFSISSVSRKGLNSVKHLPSRWSEKLDLPSRKQGHIVQQLSSAPQEVAKKAKPFYQRRLFREMLAEFIGTFLIVQIGSGSVMSAIYTDAFAGLFQIASVWIIAVLVAICTTSSISGAHLNPAVSIAFALIRPSKDFGWSKVIPYSLAQLLGAMAGSAINVVIFSSTIEAYERANGITRAAASGLASAKAFGEYFG